MKERVLKINCTDVAVNLKWLTCGKKIILMNFFYKPSSDVRKLKEQSNQNW